MERAEVVQQTTLAKCFAVKGQRFIMASLAWMARSYLRHSVMSTLSVKWTVY